MDRKVPEKMLPNYAFIIGCGRSGSTILGNILDRHPDIAHWMEPYFIWDFYSGDLEDDIRDASHVTLKSTSFIKKEAGIFASKSKARIVVDKNPFNSFRIPFLIEVLPAGKWIHLIRDGRDVAVSLRRERLKRDRIVSRRSLPAIASQAATALKRQPFWRNRLQMIWYELKNAESLSISGLANKSKWKGAEGYGFRVKNWQALFNGRSLLEIAALQWLHSEIAIRETVSLIPEENMITVYYENMIREPEKELFRILKFLNVDTEPAEVIGYDLKPDNSGKWKTVLDDTEKQLIAPIVDTMLRELGYEADTIE